MKAIRLVSPGQPLEIHDLPAPSPADEEVLVRVAGCGVCHTDVGFWKDGVKTKRPLPLTLGHEIAGTVVEAGSHYRDLVGREVIVPAVIACGECDLCRSGRSNVCRAQVMPGNDMDGGFAELVCVPGRGLCEVSDRGGYDLAELSVVADAVTTPYQAVLRSGLAEGDLAVVVGVGGVGTYCVQIAAARGGRIVAIDVDPERLEAVAGHGALHTIDGSSADPRSVRKELAARAAEWGCPPYGWKIYECSGTPGGQQMAFGLLTYASTLMVIGFTLDRIELRLSNLMAFDARAQGTWGCRPELYPEALELVTGGRVDLRPFIEIHPLERGPEILERVAAHELKRRAILVPGAE